MVSDGRIKERAVKDHQRYGYRRSDEVVATPEVLLIVPWGGRFYGEWVIFKYEKTAEHSTHLIHQRRSATPDQTNSTTPNGHAPCRKPYADAAKQAPANSRTKMRERFSSA